jgi:pyroglutamyl-peptidase
VPYYATAPIRAMVLAMRRAGVPADISDTAGTFVCNHLMYGMLHHIAQNALPIRAAWIRHRNTVRLNQFRRLRSAVRPPAA